MRRSTSPVIRHTVSYISLTLSLPSRRRRPALARERVGKYPGSTMYYSIHLALLSGSAGADPAFTRRGKGQDAQSRPLSYHSFIYHACTSCRRCCSAPPAPPSIILPSLHPPSSVLRRPRYLYFPSTPTCGYRPLKSLSTRVLKVNRRSAKWLQVLA